MSEENNGYKELGNVLRVMINSLVDNVEGVNISVRHGERTSVFEIQTTKDDIGKVIGKKGSNIGAVRTIMNAAAMKLGKRIVIEIID